MRHPGLDPAWKAPDCAEFIIGHASRDPLAPSGLRSLLGGFDHDEPAKAAIAEQDREIAEKSGKLALEIKSLERVSVKKKWKAL